MRKGQTHTIIFTSNTDLSQYDTVLLTIKDTHTVKELQHRVDIPCSDNGGDTVSFQLTQEDTLKLRTGEIRMQVRCAKSDHTPALTSNVLRVRLEDALNEDVL